MDILLGKVTQQAMSYAIRSGISITAGYAIKQSARLLKNVDGSSKEELQTLQDRLDSKIKIISPAIDMIELISARGNTSLESAVSLTKALRWDIQALGQRLATAATAEEHTRRNGTKAKSKDQNELELRKINQDIRNLLNRIEDAVPLINLAITTSGASLSTNLPATVSPSRLLQASTFLTAGDSQYSMTPSSTVQIGPPFVLSMYMLFSGHLRPQNEDEVRNSTWKEVIHKARVKLLRVPLDSVYDELDCKDRSRKGQALDQKEVSPLNSASSNGDDYFPINGAPTARADEYSYQLSIIEDLEDDRVHTFEDDESPPGRYDDVEVAGIREILPIHEVSKIFYADTGKILNIGGGGETNSPVLLLKRDVNAIPPRRMMERISEEQTTATDKKHRDDQKENHYDTDAQSSLEDDSLSALVKETQSHENTKHPDPWHIPPNLDPEWMAFEVYIEVDASDTESNPDSDSGPHRPTKPTRESSVDPCLTSSLSQLNLNTPQSSSPSLSRDPYSMITQRSTSHPPPHLPPIRTSLSLLETLLRLTSLQQFQQTSHLAITDELLNFFLSDANASTTGAGGDSQERKRLRGEARRRVGFDPYDESPVKRRGETYQQHYRYDDQGGSGSPAAWNDGQWYADEDSYYERHRSPRHDEGYNESWNTPPGAWRRYSSRTQQTPPPPLLHSRQGTPEGSSPSIRDPSTRLPANVSRRAPSKSSPPKARPDAVRREAGERRGSPLARPGTGMTDEGLGTSPASVGGEQATVG